MAGDIEISEIIAPESLRKAGEMLDKMAEDLKALTHKKLKDLLKPAETLRTFCSKTKQSFRNIYADLLKELEAQAQECDLVLERFECLLDLWGKAKYQIEIENMTLTSLENPEEIISFASTDELRTFIERWKSDSNLQKKHQKGNPYRLKINIKGYD